MYRVIALYKKEEFKNIKYIKASLGDKTFYNTVTRIVEVF
jgi:hypothetical protein